MYWIFYVLLEICTYDIQILTTLEHPKFIIIIKREVYILYFVIRVLKCHFLNFDVSFLLSLSEPCDSEDIFCKLEYFTDFVFIIFLGLIENYFLCLTKKVLKHKFSHRLVGVGWRQFGVFFKLLEDVMVWRLRVLFQFEFIKKLCFFLFGLLDDELSIFIKLVRAQNHWLEFALLAKIFEILVPFEALYDIFILMVQAALI